MYCTMYVCTRECWGNKLFKYLYQLMKPHITGGLAQLVERLLSMQEVWGSIPQFSKLEATCQYLLEKKSGPNNWK
jgi:hypothetical protein